MKVLFHLEFSKDDPAAVFDLICDNFGVSQEIRVFSRELVLGTCVYMQEIDNLITQVSRNWRLERIARVDLTILRLAVYEFLYRDDIPPKVSINEAVDIGKKFGGGDSGAFINGILDKIYNTFIKNKSS